MACPLPSQASEHHIGINSRIQSVQRNFFAARENFFLTAGFLF
jgi:hypothetical protein